MTPFATYVFVELGTSDILQKPIDIITLSMIAVTDETLMKIEEEDKDDIIVESLIDREEYWRPDGELDLEEIVDFLDGLKKPICLIAHNGMRFDFPLLKRDLFDRETAFFKDIMCADCMHFFYDFLEPNNEKTSRADRQAGAFPWPSYCHDKKSYDLPRVYSRVLEGRRSLENAQERNMAVLELVVELCIGFRSWMKKHHFRCGLLVLTGALWGCTNPFIRQGTRGLREVHADSWHRQARAELCFLLGNWRYVVPWVVNQLGSVAYLAAVRRAPLSLAVPAANGLAFAATAAAGAATGLDRPLDRGSILGIALIVAGTALCCWDQVE